MNLEIILFFSTGVGGISLVLLQHVHLLDYVVAEVLGFARHRSLPLQLLLLVVLFSERNDARDLHVGFVQGVVIQGLLLVQTTSSNRVMTKRLEIGFVVVFGLLLLLEECARAAHSQRFIGLRGQTVRSHKELVRLLLFFDSLDEVVLILTLEIREVKLSLLEIGASELAIIVLLTQSLEAREILVVQVLLNARLEALLYKLAVILRTIVDLLQSLFHTRSKYLGLQSIFVHC